MEALPRAIKALPRALTQIGDTIFARNFIRIQFGGGKKLIDNNVFRGICRDLISIRDQALRDLIFADYPELKGVVEPLDSPSNTSSTTSSIPCPSTKVIVLAEPLQGVREERRGEEHRGEEKSTLPGESEGGPAVDSPQVHFRRSKTRELARSIIDHLNHMTGREYQHTDNNLDTIATRLEEISLDTDAVKTMINRQCARWKTDPKMAEYLRITTLFNKTKFHEYFAARNLPVAAQRNHQPDHSKGF
jgi:uncharacterized phage protein (TIGR02220 family)